MPKNEEEKDAIPPKVDLDISIVYFRGIISNTAAVLFLILLLLNCLPPRVRMPSAFNPSIMAL